MMLARLKKATELASHRLHRIIHQWCGAKVDAKPGAPDGHGAILRQVDVGWNIVILVADVTFQSAQFDKTGILHCVVVLCVRGGNEIDVYIWTVRSFKVGQAQHPFAIGELEDRSRPLGFVRPCMKVTGREFHRRHSGGGRGWKLFVDPLVDKEPLWSKGVPGAGNGY